MSSLLCLCFDVLLLGLLRITSVLQHGKHPQPRTCLHAIAGGQRANLTLHDGCWPCCEDVG